MDIKKTQKTSWWKPYVLDLSFACNSIKAFDLYTNNHSSTLWTHTHTHTYTHTKTTTYDVINTCTGLVCSFSAVLLWFLVCLIVSSLNEPINTLGLGIDDLCRYWLLCKEWFITYFKIQNSWVLKSKTRIKIGV